MPRPDAGSEQPASPSDQPVSPDAPAPGPPQSLASPPRRRRRRIILWLASIVGALLIVGGISLAGAEYYTARPQFCGSCHIMDPYYTSWSRDKHGAKFDVWCVECHYAPGEQHTIMAKFRGLSQLTSYFSGRAGHSRPRAQVRDSSCMQSGCHGDGAHLKKPLPIGEPRTEERLIGGRVTQVKRVPTVHFVHDKHLNVDARLNETTARLERISGELKAALPAESRERLERALRSVKPAAQRERELQAILEELNLQNRAAEAFEWMRLEHEAIRLHQLSGIHCASCHTYNETGTTHLAVDPAACFTCHFANQAFNRETGECLRCHEPPTRQIAVHGTLAVIGGRDGAAATAPAMMDHRDIVARGIDCASCHLDVIQGDTSVTVRDCTHCHDQDRFFVDFENRTTETVQDYHRVHVAQQRARCVDCHRPISHKLIDPVPVAGSADVLRPVLDDCQHCHPGHHREQANLLMGIGGAGIDQPVPNAMFGSRMNCRACHTQPGTDFKDAPLVKATEQNCVACHGADYDELFRQWVSEIALTLGEAESALSRVEDQISRVEQAGGQVPADIRESVRQARDNIKLVRNGNGIHNKTYALQLLDLSTRNLDRAAADLSPP